MNDNTSKVRLWTARVLCGIVVLFMLFDSIGKFMKPAPVLEGTITLGYAEHHLAVIGTLGLISTILYAIPRTSVLGALLLTAYFGGAVATHIRLDNPLFSHVLFPVYLAVLAWSAIWLRNKQLRRLVPLQKKNLDA